MFGYVFIHTARFRNDGVAFNFPMDLFAFTRLPEVVTETDALSNLPLASGFFFVLFCFALLLIFLHVRFKNGCTVSVLSTCPASLDTF